MERQKYGRISAMRFRFLGTGTSVGVPQIGCTCAVCTSDDPRDKRRRCGAYVVASDGTAALLDAPPELREACLEYKISKVDMVLLTHAHMDHVAGFDDIRRFNTINGTLVSCDPASPGANGRKERIVGKPMNCMALPETIEQMHHIFPYISAKGGENGLYRPQVFFCDNTSPFNIGNVKAEAFRVSHGFACCGYIFEEGSSRLAYASDCHEIDDATVEKLRGVDILVLNCLRVREHPTHLSLERSLGYISRIAPRKAYLVHMCHDFTHQEWLEKLAGTVAEPAYDGLEVEI